LEINVKGRDRLEDLDVDGKIISMDLRERWWEFVNWINLSHDRDQWRVFVNTVMVGFHRSREISWLAE
jgi:hypothetical protein